MAGINILNAVSMTPQVLASGYLTTADAAVYTVAASSSAKIATAVLCNTTSAAVTVSVSVIPSGGAVGNAHRIINSYTINGNDSLSLNQYLAGQMMTAGDFVSGVAGTANAVVMVLTGTVQA